MPNVSGFVYYDVTETAIPGVGIANVPVALYDSTSGIGAIALTNLLGAYLFTNVPAGNYKIIEAWGAVGGLPTPVNFATSAVAMAQPIEAEPPLSAISVIPPLMADRLMALTPNLLNVTVGILGLINQNFFDGPVGDKPIVLTNATRIGPNLITAASNGTWGTWAPGTAVMTTSPLEPYPGTSPGFTYTASTTPNDGFYTVMNTRSPFYPWWAGSDHTTGLETGRFILINGSNPGSIIFTQPVNVTPNTYYALTGWVLNLINQMVGFALPQLAFKVLDSMGNQLAYQQVNAINPSIIPVWYENGFIFNTEGNSNITIEIISTGPAAVGNDYLIDDVTLYQLNLINQLSITKKASPDIIYAGTDVTFSVTVTNTSPSVSNNVSFQDILDPSLTFTAGSVTVNGSGVGYGAANPNTGFSLGNMAPGAINVVEFHAIASAGPSPVANTASTAYDMLVSGNGDVQRHTVLSNTYYLVRLLNDFSQASADLAESVALEQAALSHIINAEGEKIQAVVATGTIDQMLAVNKSVSKMLSSISKLEMVLEGKLEIVQCQLVNNLNAGTNGSC